MPTYWPVDFKFVKLGPGFMAHYDKKTYRFDYGYHTGLDFLLKPEHVANVQSKKLKVPVHAVSEGVVEFAEVRDMPGYTGYGTTVRIYHRQLGVWTRYAHLGSLTVKAGDQVTAGQKIAELGTSGTDNYHLHFDVMHRLHAENRFNPYNPAVGGVTPKNQKENSREAARLLAYFQDPLRFFNHRPALTPVTAVAVQEKYVVETVA